MADNPSPPNANATGDPGELPGLFGTHHEVAEHHPELYGRLLIANERIENAGTVVIWLMIALVIGVCATIHMAWVPAIFGIPVARLQSWIVYLLIAVGVFVVYCFYSTLAEKRAYQAVRQPVYEYLQKHHLTVPWLIAQINGDDSVDDIAEQLRKDTATHW